MLTYLRALLTVLTLSTKRRLLGAVAASVALALCEIVALLSVVPLMQLLAGQGLRSSPVLGLLADLSGSTNTSHLALVTSVVMLAAFVLKGVASIWCRWWILGFVYNEEAALSEELLRYYIRAPYSLHLQRNSAELLRTMIESVSAVFLYGVVGLVTVLSELTYLILILVTLVILLPGPGARFSAVFRGGRLGLPQGAGPSVHWLWPLPERRFAGHLSSCHPDTGRSQRATGPEQL